jgi:hypothetical protein
VAVFAGRLLLMAAAHAAQVAAGPTAPAATVASPPASTEEPQVTVEAQRTELKRRLSTYVANITRTTSRDEALHRWSTPICPAVFGMPREQGEFMLERFSQIARDAGAPLDGEHCRVNLAVVFTSEPDTLLKAWGDKRRAFGGARGTPADFNHFRMTRRPVRIWYNETFGSPHASPVLRGSMALGSRFPDVPTATGLIGSKMYIKDVLVFTSVAVIVDTRKTGGLQIGQLADYISVVALADTDLDPSLGSAPTILRLFQARAAGAPLPGELSGWDAAFLKALYNTSLDLTTQRSMMADRMLGELAH